MADSRSIWRKGEFYYLGGWFLLKLVIDKICWASLKREHLGNFAYALSAAHAEEKSWSSAHKFWMLQEAEEDRGSVVGRNVLCGHYSFQNGRLLNASDMNRGLEAHMHHCRMK